MTRTKKATDWQRAAMEWAVQWAKESGKLEPTSADILIMDLHDCNEIHFVFKID